MKRFELAAGLLVSAVMHLVLFMAMALVMDTEVVDVDTRSSVPRAAGLRDQAKTHPGRPGAGDPATAAQAAAETALNAYDAPLSWIRPPLDPDIFGPAIDTRSGRVLRVDKAVAPVLTPPRFKPYIPPVIKEKSAPEKQDVLNRTRPVSYSRGHLENVEAALWRDVARDLEDCRLDEMPLDVVILRWRYLRLQKLLFEKGLEPDFTYSEMRRFFLEKLGRIRRALDDLPPEQYFPALLYEYRKNKIYEEKRGHSLFNAIFYDIYNCRTGTEELAIYLSLFHPGLELGISRGSIIKFDGSLIGHVDPVARINGQWMVFKTVSRAPGAFAPYEIGELFPIEKLILDYLPGLDGSHCRLDRPLARNGEELDDSVAGDSENLHPLIVKHDDSRIVLLRETSPQPQNFPMITREQRLFREMTERYRGIDGARGLLHENTPYLDFIFHLQSAPAADRRDLVRLYLKNRMDTDPPEPKRPLRIPDFLPGYQDLVRTVFAPEPEPEIEIVPGTVVPTRRYLPHKAYIEAHNRAMAAVAEPEQARAKKELPPEIGRFLFFFSGPGVRLVRPPAFDPRRLAADLMADAFDLTPFMANESGRRKNGTSARRIAILKAGLAGDPMANRALLENRVALLQQVLGRGRGLDADIGGRQGYEIPGAVTYQETVANQGRTGLSPGFVKDMVELMGEGAAVSAFARYLDAGVLKTGRVAMLEMLAYMDRYLLLEENKQRLAALARGLLSPRKGLAVRTAAAQFLVRIGSFSPQKANGIYLEYLDRDPVDAATVASLLGSGLDRGRAARLFHQKIDAMDLGAAPGGHRQLEALGRMARVLGDKDALRRISDKHTAFVMSFLDNPGPAGRGGATPVARVLNSLTHLAGRQAPSPSGLFDRFVNLGAQHPEALFMGGPMGRWIGPARYEKAMETAMAVENTRLDAAVQDLERLRAGSETLWGGHSGLPPYGAALAAVRDSSARITFLSALYFQNGFKKEAYGQQRRLLRRLFALDEFQNGFEKDHGAGLTQERNRILNHEAILRAVEMAGFLSKSLGRPGDFDLNHAPFIRLKGQYQAPCGPTRRTINSKSAPKNFVFTPAGTYFIQLLDPGNPPEQVAAAFEGEQRLLRGISARPLDPERAADLDRTRDFFQGMARSGPCDIRRIYVFEKLLRQSALPENLPSWVIAMARESHDVEQRFLRRMDRAGGVAAVLEDYRRLPKAAFDEKWGENPFSIRNLYATLLLAKTGHLEIGADGSFQ